MVRERRKPNVNFTTLPFEYSMKNIPIPKLVRGRCPEYEKKLVSQLEKLARNMRWKLLFFLKNNDEENDNDLAGDLDDDVIDDEKSENYGFKSTMKPPFIKELEHFEKDLFNIPRQLEYRENKKCGTFQTKLRKDLENMKKSKGIIIAADKSRNFYSTDTETYTRIRNENITCDYEKTTMAEVGIVDKESASFARNLKLESRMQKHSKSECFITMKDHKRDFTSRPQCRLINTAKNDLGRVVKIMVERINKEIRYRTQYNQWQSSQQVLEWFNQIKNPTNFTFIKFDIVSFYPSITKKLLENAIEYARSIDGITISKADEGMILQCRQSFLFSEGEPWKKKGNKNFDVPMGSYDGAEICELVGLYLLYKMIKKNPIFMKERVGIYRDDGLALIELKNGGRTNERQIKPKLNQVFNEEDLKITIEPATQVTDYLDIKLNLDKQTHEPFRKAGDTPLYINVDSDHPQHIINHIPIMIASRLSTLSSNEEIFERHKPQYQEALKNSGYKCELKYQRKVTSKKKKTRTRKPLYFNPPYSKLVKTNVIKTFLELIDRHFPKGNKLHKCFNRATVKATYCTLNNMKERITNHNAKVMNKNEEEEKPNCNCQKSKKDECPMPNECNQKNIIYQAEVQAEGKIMTYYGSTVDFKKRYGSHKHSLKHKTANQTALSSHVWKLKDKKVPHEIRWSRKARGHPFASGGRACDLCLSEKLIILMADQDKTINKRDELLETCRHKREHLLVSIPI